MDRLANLLGATALVAADRMRVATRSAALVHLQAWPGESIEALRHVVGISQPAAVRVVDRLAADGLIERRPGNGRANALAPSHPRRRRRGGRGARRARRGAAIAAGAARRGRARAAGPAARASRGRARGRPPGRAARRAACATAPRAREGPDARSITRCDAVSLRSPPPASGWSGSRSAWPATATGCCSPTSGARTGWGRARSGLIGTGSYVGYLVAAVATGSLASRAGARATAAGGGDHRGRRDARRRPLALAGGVRRRDPRRAAPAPRWRSRRSPTLRRRSRRRRAPGCSRRSTARPGTGSRWRCRSRSPWAPGGGPRGSCSRGSRSSPRRGRRGRCPGATGSATARLRMERRGVPQGRAAAGLRRDDRARELGVLDVRGRPPAGRAGPSPRRRAGRSWPWSASRASWRPPRES